MLTPIASSFSLIVDSIVKVSSEGEHFAGREQMMKGTLLPPFLAATFGSVAANIGSAVDLDLHEKPLHRIGSIWCQNHVESNLYVFFFVHFFVFHSESILCPFKITAADITWRYVI
jgi:hypothetical protein